MSSQLPPTNRQKLLDARYHAIQASLNLFDTTLAREHIEAAVKCLEELEAAEEGTSEQGEQDQGEADLTAHP